MTSSSPSFQECCILIIEDNEFNIKLLEHTFLQMGFKDICIARDGRAGLDMTLSNRPDIVILDVIMPHMDGFEYCRSIRSKNQFSDLPVIIQSALEEKHHIVKAFEAGATDYLSKPINPEELMARVKVHLENRIMMHALARFHKRLEKDLYHAKQMQKQLIPSRAQLAEYQQRRGVDIAYRFEPSHELGGDIWGIKPLKDHLMAFHIVDFAGHGLTAAMNTFRFHTLLEEREYKEDPVQTICDLNNALCKMLPTEQFATTSYGVLDSQTGLVEYITAGSTPPLLYDMKQQTVRVLEHGGLPLGIQPDHIYQKHQVTLTRHQLLLLYSDVFLESRDNTGAFPTIDFYESALRSSPAETAEDIVARLFEALQVRNSDTTFSDDVTMVAMQLSNIPE